MLLNIIGFMLCALGGGIIGGVVAKTNNNTRGLVLSCFAMLCLIIGTPVRDGLFPCSRRRRVVRWGTGCRRKRQRYENA